MKVKVFGLTLLVALNLAGMVLILLKSESASMANLAVQAVNITVFLIWIKSLK